VFIGKDSGVTVINGFPLPSNTGISFDSYIGVLYGIAAAGSVACGVIEI